MKKILIQNKQQSTIFTLLVTVLLFSISVIPLAIHFFTNTTIIYNFLIYIVFILFFYFIYYGIYFYKMEFDNYSLSIQSRRTISSWIGSKVYNVEISNDMIIGFSFSRSFLSMNDKLLIKMKSSSGRRRFAVKIPLTLLGRRKRRRLTEIFNNIIEND